MISSESLQHTCCFLGRREICETEELREHLCQVIEDLIIFNNVSTFIFGSKSAFNSLSYELVTEIRKQYPFIKRVYIRAEFPIIGDDYREYLLTRYEDTFYSTAALGAGRGVYLKRNKEMIDRSKFCVFYYQENYTPQSRKSGTKTAFEYAVKKNKVIYRFPE